MLRLSCAPTARRNGSGSAGQLIDDRPAQRADSPHNVYWRRPFRITAQTGGRRTRSARSESTRRTWLGPFSKRQLLPSALALLAQPAFWAVEIHSGVACSWVTSMRLCGLVVDQLPAAAGWCSQNNQQGPRPVRFPWRPDRALSCASPPSTWAAWARGGPIAGLGAALLDRVPGQRAWGPAPGQLPSITTTARGPSAGLETSRRPAIQRSSKGNPLLAQIEPGRFISPGQSPSRSASACSKAARCGDQNHALPTASSGATQRDGSFSCSHRGTRQNQRGLAQRRDRAGIGPTTGQLRPASGPRRRAGQVQVRSA